MCVRVRLQEKCCGRLWRLAAGEEKNNKFIPPGFSSEELLIVCKVREGFLEWQQCRWCRGQLCRGSRWHAANLYFLKFPPFALQRDSTAVIRSGYTWTDWDAHPQTPTHTHTNTLSLTPTHTHTHTHSHHKPGAGGCPAPALNGRPDLRYAELFPPSLEISGIQRKKGEQKNGDTGSVRFDFLSANF